MSYTIVIACIAATWAFLSLLGNAEATRRQAEKLATPQETLPGPSPEEPAA